MRVTPDRVVRIMPVSETVRATPGGVAQLVGDIRDALQGVPRDFTQGRLGRAVLVLSVPMVLEMSMQSVFSVVDVYFVGRLGQDAVAILGLSDALLSLVFAVSIGLSMGAAAMVARRIGEGSPEGGCGGRRAGHRQRRDSRVPRWGSPAWSMPTTCSVCWVPAPRWPPRGGPSPPSCSAGTSRSCCSS